jgi:hypothetical protein
METTKTNDPKTAEIATRKISLSRIESVTTDQKGEVIGWEYAPPRRGERYTVSLGKGRVLRTSPVQDVKESRNALLIKTVNSIYRVEYLG